MYFSNGISPKINFLYHGHIGECLGEFTDFLKLVVFKLHFLNNLKMSKGYDRREYYDEYF